MTPRARHSVYAVIGVTAFAAISFLAFRSYLTPEMLVYFLSFKWCF